MSKFNPLTLKKSAIAAYACFLASVFMFLGFAQTCAAAMSTAEERGKEIYFSGVSPSGGPITAYFGEKKQEHPGQAATCGSCHGHDGTGRPESGLTPYNITWKYLTKSYGHIHVSGLTHGPFNETDLKHYLKTGIYPGGKTGDPAMPLYSMSEQDLDDLLAYMRRLGELLDPGLGEGFIRVGTLIPGEGPGAAAGAAIRDLLSAYFSDLNKIGGIYGRRIELVVHEIRGGRQTTLTSVKEWLVEQQPFVLVSTFTPYAEQDVLAAASARGIPAVGPFTLYPTEDFTLNRQVFYLFAGLGVQTGALIRYAGEHLKLADPQSAVLYPEKKSLKEVIAAAEQASKDQKWPAIQKKPFVPGAFDADASAVELQEEGADLIVFLGVESQLRSFLNACARRKWMPLVLAPGVLVGSILEDAPPQFEKRLYLAYPTLPQDRKDWAIRELSRLMQTHDLQQNHPQVIISAYCAAKILTHAVRLAGRDLDRTKFTDRLEKFYQFDTGLAPLVTFTRNRRIGTNGAYILGFNLQNSGQGGMFNSAQWVDFGVVYGN